MTPLTIPIQHSTEGPSLFDRKRKYKLYRLEGENKTVYADNMIAYVASQRVNNNNKNSWV